MTSQAWHWGMAGACLFLAVFAGWSDQRRNKRANLNKVGWVPWGLVQILAGLGTIVLAALALMSR